MSVLYHPERLRGVNLMLVAFVHRVASLMPFDVLVVSGLRTEDQQLELWAQGRTKPGPGANPSNPLGRIVTRAMSYAHTPHGRGAAVDLAPMRNGRVDWMDTEAFRCMGAVARDTGVEWGGNWKTFVDLPHFELRGWRHLPLPEQLARRSTSGKGSTT